MSSQTTYDIVVIGAGIAGASVAAELAASARVLLCEMEDRPGYHTTGRSAAVFAPNYGPPPIQALTRASEPAFLSKDGGTPLLTPREVLFVASDAQLGALDEAQAALGLERLDAEAARRQHPLLRADYVAGALRDQGSSDIDVNALHQGYLRQFAARGGTLTTKAEVTGLVRDGTWRIETKAGTFQAPIVVNAAGAWADTVGQTAGAEPIGLVPKRRAAMLVEAPSGMDHCPMVVDIDEQFYLKPDAGRLLISPANEDPDMPSDVQPTEMDIALCIDRIQTAFDLPIRRIESRWAGLRSFVADKCPVVGYSERAEGLFWLAGQGGYGIQTAPALSQLAAAMVLGNALPEPILAEGLAPEDLAVGRLATP